MFPFILFSQIKLKDGYKKFYFDNGNISSEGLIKNGKPNGYWYAYYPSGIIKSEGNRKLFLLDSTWVFYDVNGNERTKINYKNNKKNGLKTTYSDSCNIIITENYVNDTLQGFITYYYDTNVVIKSKQIFYADNIATGKGYEYGKDGRITTLLTYKKGTLIGKEIINRFDKNGNKKGVWKSFYNSGKLKQESNYNNGLLNGYLKEYDEDGKLLKATLYIDGVAQLYAEELATLDIKKEYYPNGTVKKEGTYDVTGKEHGTLKFYDEKGNLMDIKIYRHGILLAKGIVDEEDRRQGYWEEYYENGDIKSKGKEDGMMHEYYDDGTLITEGEFIDGLKDGPWFYEMGDHTEKGSYRDGLRNGEWNYFYPNNKLSFKGSFIDGVPNGKHEFYYTNGKLQREEFYEMGVKYGTWKTYNDLNQVVFTITFKDGNEYKIDGTKLK